tara:strand:- start:197 stop:550 length:354 start_codon:yes stop_codon:yes gene_type:complete
MGWTFNINKQTKKQYVEELINSLPNKLYTKTNLFLNGVSIRGNEIWVSWTNEDLKVMYLVLYKISCYESTWGYKCIDITMGPYSRSIPPKKFLKYPLFFQNDTAEKWLEEYKAKYIF